MNTTHGMTGINRLERARRAYVAHKGQDALIDLTNSRFDRAGLAVPEELYNAAWSRWRAQPAYTPSGRGGEEARTAVATYLMRRSCPVDPDGIVVTAGSSISYHLLFAHLRDAGTDGPNPATAPPRVALPLPGYPLFEELVADAGLIPCWYHCVPEREFQPDPAEIETLLRGNPELKEHGPVVAVVVISPNNPTGVVLSPVLEQLIAASCDRHGAMLIIDEVFEPFVTTDTFTDPFEAHPGPTATSDSPVARIHGLSKLAAAPEIKFGWIAITGGNATARRELIDDLDTRHDTYLTVSGFAEACASVFLSSATAPDELSDANHAGGSWLETVRYTVNGYRAALDEYLEMIPDLEDRRRTVNRGGIHRVLQMEPTCAAMRFGTLDDEEIAIRILTETGVLIHPGYLYGLHAEAFGSGPWFVISCLNTDAVLVSAVRRLVDILR